MKVSPEIFRIVAPSVPKEARLKAAKGEMGLPPAGAVTALYILGRDRDAEVSALAKKALEEYPLDGKVSALDHDLDPLVIRKIAELHRDNEAVLIMAALNPGTDDETLKWLAAYGPPSVIEALIENPSRLAKDPGIAEALGKNPLASKGAVERALSISRAPKGEVAGEQGALPEEFKKEGEPKKEDETYSLLKRIQEMNVAKKIKLALLGNKEAREILIKESNKMVQNAVLRNPRISEEEVIRITSSKSASDELLRMVARNKDWVKNYHIKSSLVLNPKTPLAISLKLLDSLYAQDISKIAKSKNVPSVLATAARRKLEAARR